MRRPRIGLVFQLFLRASRLQRKRAALTVAAIAWGSLSLLLLLAFGEGLRLQMSRARAGMGSDIAVVWPGETTKPWQGLPAGRPVRARVEDVEFLRQRIPWATGIIGEFRTWSVNYTSGRKTVNAQLIGTHVEYGELRNHIAAAGGRFLDPIDERERRRVVFLGNELATDLFGEESPLEQQVLLNNVPYTVVGVMAKKMQMGTYGGPDANHGVIPITTFQAQFGHRWLGNLVLKTPAPERMPELLTAMRETLGPRLGFDPEDTRAMPVWDTVESSKVMRNILIGIQLFLGVIGSLTLVIGGIGVANIMYATVKERTREIGVKMALGARPGWITGPLLLEGVMYTAVGGLLGLIGAIGLVILIGMAPTEGNRALEFLGKPTLSPKIGIAAAGVLGLIGLLSGYFPARRAARVDPAETLRYE